MDWTDGEDAALARHLGEGPDDPRPPDEDELTREREEAREDRRVKDVLLRDAEARVITLTRERDDALALLRRCKDLFDESWELRVKLLELAALEQQLDRLVNELAAKVATEIGDKHKSCGSVCDDPT